MEFTPLKLKLFLAFKLPLAFIAGLKLEKLTNSEAHISVKYSFLTQNPFKSIYFAVLCMTGELASGILCLRSVQQSGIPVSMLVTKMQVSFQKKAVGKITFRCEDGDLIKECVKNTIDTKQGKDIETLSVGYNANGDVIAEMKIQWSFKAKA
ncbi:MAG: DUF4442 domain-containing protein [Cytophagales bacterium]